MVEQESELVPVLLLVLAQEVRLQVQEPVQLVVEVVLLLAQLVQVPAGVVERQAVVWVVVERGAVARAVAVQDVVALVPVVEPAHVAVLGGVEPVPGGVEVVAALVRHHAPLLSSYEHIWRISLHVHQAQWHYRARGI